VNNEEGIFFEDSNSNNLIDNNCSFNNDIGIYLCTSNDNNSLSNNTCSNNQYGIELVSSMGNKLWNNTCISNDEAAIDLWYSDNNTLSNNNFSSSRNDGIFLVESSDNNITRNQLCYNGGYGVRIMNGECSNNMIWNNTLVDNNGTGSTYDPSHVQAYDDGTANWWNSTDGYGNYWSDWISPDDDMDGIVDFPYEIGGSAGAKDWYPLTERPDIAEEPPVADAGPDQTVDEDTVVTLDGSESYDAIAVMNWTWTFTDGVLRTLYGEIVEWSFPHPGVYTITLVVRDTIEQESAPDTCVITVRDVTPPVANAGADMTLFMSVGTQITFNGSASSDNVDVVSYTWTLVDVTSRTLTGITPTYTFTGPGVYTVTLNVSDAAANYATDTVVVTVLDDVDPVADAGLDQNTLAGATVTFDGSGSSDDVGIVNYTWTFTDGTEKTLYEVGQTYTFETPGTYPVTLNVSDAAANYATDTVIITVLEANEPPVADAGANQTVTAGDLVTFDGSASTDDSGSIENYTWSFTYDGEAMKLYGVIPKFTFDIAGTYVVTLTVEDADGETDTDTVTITAEENEKSFIESYGLAIGIAIALAIVAVALFLVLKGRRGGMAPSSMEEVPVGEPTATDDGLHS
jgi:parallel beta-helix repeat protein